MKKATQNHLIKIGIAAMFLAPSFAFAHNYNYLEGGYLNRDQPGDDDGFRIAGSFDVLSPVAVFAEYNDVDHIDQLSIGGLWHMPLNNQLDLNLGGSYERFDYQHGDDSGYGLRADLRWMMPNTRLELDPGIRYIDLGGHNGDATSARLGAQYQLTAALDLQAAVQAGDDDRLEAGVRYNFGPRMTGN